MVTITVLHILGPLRPSGMERMLVTAADYLRREGIHSIVLGQGDHHPFEAALQSAGYEVTTLQRVGIFQQGSRDLRKLVQGAGVDVIHIHTESDYLRTALAARWALGRRGSIVRTIHNVFDASGYWRAKRFAQAMIADRLMSAIVAPSQEVAANERRIFRRLRVIWNWVDDSFFDIRARRAVRSPKTNTEPVALIVGNCSQIKHHELALQALMSSNHKVAHIGDESGASPEELDLLRSLEADGRLIDRGVKSPTDALLEADYFMMPSRHEGMGVALAEAVVAGVPALVNDTPGMKWASQEAFVSMLPDDEDAWMQAVTGWTRKREDLRASALDFSAARGAREYAEVYREAIKSGRVSRLLAGS